VRDQNARSHTGTWDLFRRQFVLTGDFDEASWRAAQHAQGRREASDYGAAAFELAEARELVDTARAFVAAVERLIG
jgi:uncharacterized protein (UPF0332 family)